MLTDMLKFISNYPISRRLIVAFALAAILPSLMIAVMGAYYANQINARSNASQAMANAQTQVSGLGTGLQHMYAETSSLNTLVLNDLLVPNPKGHSATLTKVLSSAGQTNGDENQFNTSLTSFQNVYDPSHGSGMQAVSSMLASVAPNDDMSQMEANALTHFATDSWPKYQAAQDAELNLLKQVESNPGQFTTAHAVAQATQQISNDAQTVDSTYASANTDWTLVASYVNRINNELNGNNSQSFVTTTIVLFLLNILIVVGIGLLVLRSITGPLTELVSLTKRISKGDTTARAHVNSHDEISIVGNAMNNMLENIVHLIQDTQAQRDVLQGQVEKLVSEVSGVGEGDLRVQAEVTADALGVLADSFNYMVEELGSLVVRVKMVAREVEESTTMTSDRMGELVETADRQIQQIANAAIEIERMAMTSQQVAGRAMALASSAREARVNAQGGRLAVQQTIEGMGRIHSNVQETSNKVQTLGDRSREINNIVDAISTIAHQTNRLALDAAIQAAMAGDNGKGFGAVAADIRRLAERAKEQATSVGRIVRSVRDDIGAVAISMRDTERETSAGAQLAEEAGTSLESIFSVIERQAREIEVINQVAMQQQQSSGTVVQIMQTVTESTQESTKSTRGAAQNMERIARLAEQLLASVEAFKLRESLNYFAPNANASMIDENMLGSLTSSGHFRTVTATAQPISNGGSYNSLPPVRTGPVSLGGNFAQPQPYASDPYAQSNGNGNSQQLFLPPGNNSRQLSTQGNGQQFQPFQGNNSSGPLSSQAQGNVQSPFPPLGNESVTFSFPPLGDGQPPFQGQSSQQPYPPQSGWDAGSQQPAANDWQSGNWKQSDWQ